MRMGVIVSLARGTNVVDFAARCSRTAFAMFVMVTT